ncbi:MAG: hypothetical protein ACI9R3_003370 [Verrucomicrobiales bacterium]
MMLQWAVNFRKIAGKNRAFIRRLSLVARRRARQTRESQGSPVLMPIAPLSIGILNFSGADLLINAAGNLTSWDYHDASGLL